MTERGFVEWRAGYVPEASIAPMLARWRGPAPALPDDEVERLRAFLRSAQAF